MEPFIIVAGVLFSVIATVILSYISIATMVGPWIAPTIVLIGHVGLAFMRSSKKKTATLVSIQAIGAGGGIVATGVGFALPMLYFLEPETFMALMAAPQSFCLFISALCLIAGGIGLLLGKYLTKPLLDQQQLPFPVSNLTVQIASSDASGSQTRTLLAGIIGSGIICAIRDGFGSIAGVIKKTYYLAPSFLGKEAALSVWPTLWAIGFSVGLPITIPLVIGMLAKYVVISPLAQHANYLPISLFKPLDPEVFAVAFCSGLVACELILQAPGMLKNVWKNKGKARQSLDFSKKLLALAHKGLASMRTWSGISIATCSTLAVACTGFLSWHGFNLGAQVLLISFCAMATYSICSIGGKIGMIPFGRFSTFIVIPLLLMFSLSPLQATIVCVFFNIAAATASDLLFDMKSADMTGISRKKMYGYQWLGLVACAASIGIVLWLLFTNLELGSEALFAQRSKAKALLLQSLHMDANIVLLGIGFGWILKRFKINSTMVFGGLLMPNGITIGLLLGSLGTLLTKKTDRWVSLCAGILAAESLWVMVSILLNK
jgi:hypothetical protein